MRNVIHNEIHRMSCLETNEHACHIMSCSQIVMKYKKEAMRVARYQEIEVERSLLATQLATKRRLCNTLYLYVLCSINCCHTSLYTREQQSLNSSASYNVQIGCNTVLNCLKLIISIIIYYYTHANGQYFCPSQLLKYKWLSCASYSCILLSAFQPATRTCLSVRAKLLQNCCQQLFNYV